MAVSTTAVHAQHADTVQPTSINSKPSSCWVAFKTNALAFPILEPNGGIEFGFAGRFSIGIDGYRPRFHNVGKKSIEVNANLWGGDIRYWLKPWNKEGGRSMKGHFFGAYYTEGMVDLQYNEKGNQAEVITTGLEYGYVFPIAKHCRLELGLGVGYLRADYDHFKVAGDGKQLNYCHSGRTTWWGPTKANVSFVLLLGKGAK